MEGKQRSTVCEEPKEMSEVLNKNFQKVFTTESEFKKPQGQVKKSKMWAIRIDKEEIKEIMQEQDERKATEPS